HQLRHRGQRDGPAARHVRAQERPGAGHAAELPRPQLRRDQRHLQPVVEEQLAVAAQRALPARHRPAPRPVQGHVGRGVHRGLRHVLATAVSDDVAALIAEPIQGVGGFTMPPDGLFAAYKEVLDEQGILFISDEVQTGWGRTGSAFFGIQNHGVTPDMMTFAKGLGNGFAVGGVVARGDLLDGLHAAGVATFGGNPISMAAANATLDYVLDHDLQANAAKTGKIIIDGLREAAKRLPVVKDVRGKGLMFAVELNTPAQATRDRKSTRLNSSHVKISYAVFCLKKKSSNSYGCRWIIIYR